MFGGDYPLFGYERLVSDWKAEGYAPEMLEKIFHRNAETFLQELGASMDLKLKGKIAIVGGASQGIGYRHRADAGRRRRQARHHARAAKRSCAQPRKRSEPRPALEMLPVPADCRRPRIASASWQEPSRHYGGIDILVNNDGAPPLGELVGIRRRARGSRRSSTT